MMQRLTREERKRALGMLQANLGVHIIARRINCHHSTISRLRDRFRATGRTADPPRPGQPRVTTPRQDVFIRQQHLRDRFMPATVSSRQIHGMPGQVCANTVRRRLQAAGIRARRPYVGPVLTQQHRRRRLQWATVHRRWTRRQCSYCDLQ